MFPIIPANSATAASGNDEGIFGYGQTASNVSMTNLVSNAGVVASDVAGVGSVRRQLAACEYGGDKGIFGFGCIDGPPHPNVLSMTNLVSNTGVVASDVTGVGTARYHPSACSYGGDKGIFGFGRAASYVYTAATNLVSNAGVVASDQAAATGTGRKDSAACEYGGDKGIFGYGNTSGALSMTNLVSNAGVVSSDVTGVGTARGYLAACGYGGDKGIFGFGDIGQEPHATAVTNLVSNAGVVASDQATVTGTARTGPAATQYGQDKGIFGYGNDGSDTAVTNLVSNTGVVASDQAATTGTARNYLAACSFN